MVLENQPQWSNSMHLFPGMTADSTLMIPKCLCLSEWGSVKVGVCCCCWCCWDWVLLPRSFQREMKDSSRCRSETSRYSTTPQSSQMELRSVATCSGTHPKGQTNKNWMIYIILVIKTDCMLSEVQKGASSTPADWAVQSLWNTLNLQVATYCK